MYSTFNEGKSVEAEIFMTATGKNVYYDVLDDVVNEYNNTKHNTIKMKPKDVGDNKRVYNWSTEIFIVNKINDTVPYTCNLKDLNGEEIIGSFYDRELQKSIL